jgi:5'(3')-deoxyribonucleotidase
MHKRHIVMCDLDDCINNLIPATIQQYEEITGEPFSCERLICFNLDKCLDRRDIDIICSIWADIRFWEKLKPQPRAAEALHAIQESGCDLYIATATDIRNAYTKQQWLAKYFPFIESKKLIIIQDKTLLKCDFIIDDKLEMLKECSPTTNKICVQRMWNQQSRSDDAKYGIRRVADLYEAYEVISGIVKEEREF